MRSNHALSSKYTLHIEILIHKTACSCLKLHSDCVHVVELGCGFVVLIPTGPQSCTIYPSLAF